MRGWTPNTCGTPSSPDRRNFQNQKLEILDRDYFGLNLDLLVAVNGHKMPGDF